MDAIKQSKQDNKQVITIIKAAQAVDATLDKQVEGQVSAISASTRIAKAGHDRQMKNFELSNEQDSKQVIDDLKNKTKNYQYP